MPTLERLRDQKYMKNSQKYMLIWFNTGIITQGVVGSLIGGHIRIPWPRKPSDNSSNDLQGMFVNWKIRGKTLQDITK